METGEGTKQDQIIMSTHAHSARDRRREMGRMGMGLHERGRDDYRVRRSISGSLANRFRSELRKYLISSRRRPTPARGAYRH